MYQGLSEMSGSVKPQLPNDTRWNSQLKCIETFIRNRPFMMIIVAQNEDLIDTRIRNLIHNVGLFNEVKNLQSQLQPVSVPLDKLQSDTSTIADSCEIWLDLLPSPSLAPYSDKVRHRFRQAMTPTHYLAYLLHPMYRGKKLDSDHTNSVQEILLKIDVDSVPELLNFMSDSLPIPKTLVHESVISKTKPKVWWSSIERSNSVNKTLCQLAMKLLSMPLSSPSLEHVFSNFGVIQTKLRNSLGLQKAAKLVFCYRFLCGKENIDW